MTVNDADTARLLAARLVRAGCNGVGWSSCGRHSFEWSIASVPLARR